MFPKVKNQNVLTVRLLSPHIHLSSTFMVHIDAPSVNFFCHKWINIWLSKFDTISRADEVQTLRRRAQEFLSQAKSALEQGYYDLSSLFSEQAAQLYLESVLLQQIGDYPRIYSLKVLLSEILKLTPSKTIDAFVRENRIKISALEDTYIMARYTTKSYTSEDAEEFLKLADELIDKVQELIKK